MDVRKDFISHRYFLDPPYRGYTASCIIKFQLGEYQASYWLPIPHIHPFVQLYETFFTIDEAKTAIANSIKQRIDTYLTSIN